MEAKTGATARLSYEEFEPFCRWQREEARDTLLVELRGFKKEQLRVHINNRGILKISGERKLSATKGSKFYKEVVVARNCNTNAIQAKFSDNQLCIIMPKTVNAAAGPQEGQATQPPVNAAAVPEQKVGSTLDPTAKPEARPQEGQATQPPVNAAAVPEQKVSSTLDPIPKPEACPQEGQATQPPQKPGEEKDSIIVPSGKPIATAPGKSNGNVTEGEKTTLSRGKQLANIALNVEMPEALLAALMAFVLMAFVFMAFVLYMLQIYHC